MTLRTDFTTPTYKLDDIKRLLEDPNSRIITEESHDTAILIGYHSEEEMVGAVLLLDDSDFYKTMPSNKKPGLFHDVYKTKDPSGRKLYIKLQISVTGCGVIISFKRDES